MKQEKQKKEEGEERKSKDKEGGVSEDCCVSFKPQNLVFFTCPNFRSGYFSPRSEGHEDGFVVSFSSLKPDSD